MTRGCSTPAPAWRTSPRGSPRTPGSGSTAQQIALRLGHTDAFPAADRAIRAILLTNDIFEAADQFAARWQPWRALAATHLIAAGVPALAA